MPAISASDVSYSMEQRKGVVSDKDIRYSGTISFGNGSLTYPTGGIPLDIGKLGFRNKLDSLVISDDSHGDGLVYKFDSANNKILIYHGNYSSPSAGPLVEVPNTYAPAATTLKVIAYGS
jgi:hypothetical protein